MCDSTEFFISCKVAVSPQVPRTRLSRYIFPGDIIVKCYHNPVHFDVSDRINQTFVFIAIPEHFHLEKFSFSG